MITSSRRPIDEGDCLEVWKEMDMRTTRAKKESLSIVSCLRVWNVCPLYFPMFNNLVARVEVMAPAYSSSLLCCSNVRGLRLPFPSSTETTNADTFCFILRLRLHARTCPVLQHQCLERHTQKHAPVFWYVSVPKTSSMDTCALCCSTLT